MFWFIVLVLGVSVFEIRDLLKQGQKKEMGVFIVIGAASLIYGYYIFKNITTASLIHALLHLVGVHF